jgi:hypothetical protein
MISSGAFWDDLGWAGTWQKNRILHGAGTGFNQGTRLLGWRSGFILYFCRLAAAD